MLFSKKKKRDIDEGKIVVEENRIDSKIESYNRLKDNILYINADGTKKVIQIESSIAHEGKTTIISNLAVSLGLTDKSVVVVDLDFRCPKLHQRFDTTIELGIAEYMLGSVELNEIKKSTKYKNVDIITRGTKIYNSSLVFVSEKFKAFIEQLRSEYDYVLLDCPPVLEVSDYINILPASDGVLFIVAYGETTRHQVSEAVKELRKNGAEIIGTVFSKYERKKDKGYNYYGKGYYSYYKNSLDADAEKDE